jgi:hypothetical protein
VSGVTSQGLPNEKLAFFASQEKSDSNPVENA